MKNFRKMIMVIVATVISMGYVANAQVAINTDGNSPDASAMLDVKSTEKGFLPPRLSTTEMNDISSPAEGLMVYNTTVNSVCFYDGSVWKMMYNNDGETCGTINYGGQNYETVIIGTQCWMAENLNIGTKIDGIGNQTDNGIIEKYCYNDQESNCDTYGGLYQWDEMMQYVTTEGTQGICPSGWHLPTDAEWKTMEMYLGLTQTQADATGWRGTDEGGKIKETGLAHWNSPNTGATNSSGFTGLPGGIRDIYGGFSDLAYIAYFLTSSQYGTDMWDRAVSNNHADVGRSAENQSFGFSVRCIKN